MGSLLETLTSQLGGDTMNRIGRQLGTDEKTAGAATGTALTALLGALARNTDGQQGAQSLHQALSKDHDGTALEKLPALVDDPSSGPGDGILRHVLGNKRALVEQGLSSSSGIDKAAAGKLLTMLAPVVMGALGQQQRKQGLDASGLAGLLGQQRQQLASSQPQAMGLMQQLLDADGDGDVDIQDVAKHGAGMLGKFFGK